jgi:hypothetical protein
MLFAIKRGEEYGLKDIDYIRFRRREDGRPQETLPRPHIIPEKEVVYSERLSDVEVLIG